MHCGTPNSPRMKKTRMSKSTFEAMLMVFFDISEIIMIEWISSEQIINQFPNKEILIRLRERVGKTRSNMWKNDWILQQNSITYVFAVPKRLIVVN